MLKELGSIEDSPIHLSPKTYLATFRKFPASNTILQRATPETPCITAAEQVSGGPVPYINILPPTPSMNGALLSPVTMENASASLPETEYEQHVRNHSLNFRDGQFVPSWSRKGIHTFFQSGSEENAFLFISRIWEMVRMGRYRL